MANLQDLLSVKGDFGCLIDGLQPWILSHFVVWLDLKIAEYKVYGYMMLDESDHDMFGSGTGHSSHSPDPSPLNRSTPPKSRRQIIRDDGHGVNIVPKPLSPKNIQSCISRRNQVEKGGHYQTMNSLFLNSFSKKQGVERTLNFSQGTVASPDKALVHAVVSQELQTSSDNRANMYVSLMPNQEPDRRVADRLPVGSHMGVKHATTSSPDSSHSVSQASNDGYRPSTNAGLQQDGNSGTTALYKNQQFSTLISDSRGQKLDQVSRWNAGEKSASSENETNEIMKDVTVIDFVDGCHGQSTSSQDNSFFQEDEKDYSFNNDSASQTKEQQSVESNRKGHTLEQMNQSHTEQRKCHSYKDDGTLKSFSSVVIKIESDGEELLQVQSDTTGVTSLDETSSDISNFKSLYMDDESTLAMAGNSGAVVPVELVPHGNLPSMSLSDINLSLYQGLASRKRRYVRTKPFASTSSCVARDPISGKFVCQICNGKFQNRSSFFRHKSLHGEKRLQCFVCMKRFHRKEHASMHMNRHGKNGELICPLCHLVGHDTMEMEEHFSMVHKIRSMYTYIMHSGMDIVSETAGYSPENTGYSGDSTGVNDSQILQGKDT